MKILEALLVEGTSKFAILCYGIFPEVDLDRIFGQLENSIAGQNVAVYRFIDKGWPNGILLIEYLVPNEKDITKFMLGAFNTFFP